MKALNTIITAIVAIFLFAETVNAQWGTTDIPDKCILMEIDCSTPEGQLKEGNIARLPGLALPVLYLCHDRNNQVLATHLLARTTIVDTIRVVVEEIPSNGGSAGNQRGSFPWLIDGNNFIDDDVNFLGTLDSQDVVIKTDNTERFRVKADGTVHSSSDLKFAVGKTILVEPNQKAFAYRPNPHYGMEFSSTFQQYRFQGTGNTTSLGIGINGDVRVGRDLYVGRDLDTRHVNAKHVFTEGLTLGIGYHNGWVLTSDSSGNATWQPPVSGSTVWNLKSNGALEPIGSAAADADGDHALAAGYSTEAEGDYSFAIGWGTNALGDYSSAIGKSSAATGIASVVAGHHSTASGDYSVALGAGALATNYGSVAAGMDVEAHGMRSFAANYKNWARGYASAVFGSENHGNGHHTFIGGGYGNIAQAAQSTVFGRFGQALGDTANWVWSDPLFVIGNGSQIGGPHNALTVLKAGSVGIATDNPQRLLHVNGHTLTDELTVQSGAYFPAYVGIGTNNPQAALHVQGTMLVTDEADFSDDVHVDGRISSSQTSKFRISGTGLVGNTAFVATPSGGSGTLAFTSTGSQLVHLPLDVIPLSVHGSPVRIKNVTIWYSSFNQTSGTAGTSYIDRTRLVEADNNNYIMIAEDHVNRLASYGETSYQVTFSPYNAVDNHVTALQFLLHINSVYDAISIGPIIVEVEY